MPAGLTARQRATSGAAGRVMRAQRDQIELQARDLDSLLAPNHTARTIWSFQIFKVRSDRSKILPEYPKELVGSHCGKGYFLRVPKRTTGIASINKTLLSAFPVHLPPLTLQRAFARLAEAVESIAKKQAMALSTAHAGFAALLSRSFAPD